MVSCMLMTPNQLSKCILDFRVPDTITSAKLKSINGTNDGSLRKLLLSSSPIISWEILISKLHSVADASREKLHESHFSKAC